MNAFFQNMLNASHSTDAIFFNENFQSFITNVAIDFTATKMKII